MRRKVRGARYKTARLCSERGTGMAIEAATKSFSGIKEYQVGPQYVDTSSGTSRRLFMLNLDLLIHSPLSYVSLYYMTCI